MNFSPETAAGVITITGGVMLVLRRLGWLALGKNNNNGSKDASKGCPDKQCQGDMYTTRDTVIEVKTQVKSIDDTQKIMVEDIKDVGKCVARIEGAIGKRDSRDGP